ncbi:Reverse transcriptase [Phytophthora palmivora]|uniref:Reverse transcriptase n=1 Tax=Phytophthora palmivora TaxID=4796 RepID=A0A2P4YGU0_9STRA|nr:Reverse transcriptase [Phytophthora palmivora]
MDFVTPLPRTRRGNTSLLLFQCSFTGYIVAKAMDSTKAQDVADVFEEYVFRRFGAPSMIRHDRDPRFMSKTFEAFMELIQSRSRATLSYRPQANGQQESTMQKFSCEHLQVKMHSAALLVENLRLCFLRIRTLVQYHLVWVKDHLKVALKGHMMQVGTLFHAMMTFSHL